MKRCIFCDKQTNNEYRYYVADKADSVREKISVFACTKCLNKKSVILPIIIMLFFVISLLGNIDQMSSGERNVETGTFVFIAAIILVSLLWTVYKVFRIVSDKPLSETSAAKKLMQKAKRTNPAKFYYTPAENALLPIKQEEKTKDPLMIIYEEVQNGKDINVDVIATASVEHLIRLYSSSPKGEGFLVGSNSAERVRMVGELLNKVGGFQLMLVIHKHFASSYQVYGAARNLEMVWDGIGSWRG